MQPINYCIVYRYINLIKNVQNAEKCEIFSTHTMLPKNYQSKAKQATVHFGRAYTLESSPPYFFDWAFFVRGRLVFAKE